MDIRITKQIINNAHKKASVLQSTMQENPVLFKMLIENYANALNEVRTFINKGSFDSVEDEIYFFKHCKTELVSYYIYYIKLLDLYSECINLSPSDEIKRHIQVCKVIKKFRSNHLHLIKYFEKESTHLDSLYFTINGAKVNKYSDPSLIQADVLFTTTQDFLFGQYKAFKMIEKYSRTRIDKIQQSSVNKANKGRLHWKKTKVALVELLTSIYKSGSIEEDFNTIVEEFEIFLGVSKLDVHNKYAKIRNRNNPTQFLDELKQTISDDVEEYFEGDN